MSRQTHLHEAPLRPSHRRAAAKVEADARHDSSHDDLAAAQHAAGNQAMQRRLAPAPMIEIGRDDDPLEREADAAADAVSAAVPNRISVTRSPVARLARQPRHDAGGPHASMEAAASMTVPRHVERAIASPGTPLDPATRRRMGDQFGFDFGCVTLHTGTAAADSARALGAAAYTFGDHIVFNQGRHAETSRASAAGTGDRRLLAHELAHVVQQSGGTALRLQRQPEKDAGPPDAAPPSADAGPTQGPTQAPTPAAGKNPLSAVAEAIIADAQDKAKGTDAPRAVAAVRKIVATYFATDASLVDSVVFDDAKAGSGLHTQQKFSATSKPEESTGTIFVGNAFLAGVTKAGFARRVLQVGHEIQHIKQWRSNTMAGPSNQPEREFLAFYWEAMTPELSGTGSMSHATRVALIDAALGNFYCMPDAKQKDADYLAKRDALLVRRKSEQSASGHDPTSAPAACKKSN